MEKEIIERLERIEMQSKVNWWDNLMFYAWTMLFVLIIGGFMIKNLFFVTLCVLCFIFLTCLIEYFEKKDLREVTERRKHEKEF